jgi:hypothetical protein
MLGLASALLISSVAVPATADTSVPGAADRAPQKGGLAAVLPGTVDHFQTFVRVLASKRGQAVLDWWAADLDRDGVDERIAMLCDDNDLFGDFVVENRSGQRWDLRFRRPVAGPQACPHGATAALPFAHRPGTTIDIEETFRHHDYDEDNHKVCFALREGELVIVRAETWGGKITDWDWRVRWLLARSYPRPSHGELSSPHNNINFEVALRDPQ